MAKRNTYWGSFNDKFQVTNYVFRPAFMPYRCRQSHKRVEIPHIRSILSFPCAKTQPLNKLMSEKRSDHSGRQTIYFSYFDGKALNEVNHFFGIDINDSVAPKSSIMFDWFLPLKVALKPMNASDVLWSLSNRWDGSKSSYTSLSSRFIWKSLHFRIFVLNGEIISI